MVEIYADLVLAGVRSIDGLEGVKQVPDKYLELVIEELKRRKLK
ncbi:CD1375 family protein [Clostridium paraputrificum]